MIGGILFLLLWFLFWGRDYTNGFIEDLFENPIYVIVCWVVVFLLSRFLSFLVNKFFEKEDK